MVKRKEEREEQPMRCYYERLAKIKTKEKFKQLSQNGLPKKNLKNATNKAKKGKNSSQTKELPFKKHKGSLLVRVEQNKRKTLLENVLAMSNGKHSIKLKKTKPLKTASKKENVAIMADLPPSKSANKAKAAQTTKAPKTIPIDEAENCITTNAGIFTVSDDKRSETKAKATEFSTKLHANQSNNIPLTTSTKVSTPNQPNDADESIISISDHDSTVQTPKAITSKNYDFSMIQTDDSTDDEGNVDSTKRPPLPNWSRTENRIQIIIKQAQVNSKIVDKFFGVNAENVDLSEIFPKIKATLLMRRESSFYWKTPPRYSMLPKY